jgi:hypothetical protein
MRYRFMISNVAPFTRLVIIPGPFPNAFAANSTNPRASGFLWITQFNAQQPTVYQWNLNVQQDAGRNILLSAAYVGSRGVHLMTGDSSNVRSDFQMVNGQKFFPGAGPRVNPNFGAIQLLGFNGDSYYHGLQLGVTKRYTAGLLFQASYTFSKAMDTNSSIDTVFSNGPFGGDRQDPFNSRLDRARADFDVRHNFVANFLYDLPFGRGRRIASSLTGVVGKLVEGWSAGGILNIRSGFPFGAVLGFDRARNGIDNAQSQRPNLTPGRDLKDAITGNPERYVDASFFQLQPAGFYGNAARNGLTGPNLRVFDFTLFKRTPITERLDTEFRVEAFNLFNRTNLTPPDFVNRVLFTGADANGNGVVPQSFGQLTRTSTSARQLQFGLRVSW